MNPTIHRGEQEGNGAKGRALEALEVQSEAG